MTRRALGCAVLSALSAAKAGLAQGRDARAYRAALYRGLVIGKSLRSSSLKALGKPTYTGPVEGDAQSLEDGYEGTGLFPLPYYRFRVLWDRKTSVIHNIEVQLKEPIPVELLKRQFGGRWILTRWDQDVCPDQGLETLYPSRSGAIAIWENRSNGLSYGSESMVFEFRSKPLGLPRSRGCK